MNLNRLAYFVAVVDSGSFTGAAARLGMTKAVVSQQVSQLEHEIGTTLLIRTTRRVQPTEAGRLFHQRCAALLRDADDAVNELAHAAAEPTGTLRIAAPNDYGTSAVVPVVTAYAARYPGCRVVLSLQDSMADLAADGIDVAIRVGWLEDSSLQARRIGSFRQLLVCSPSLADQIAGLNSPQEVTPLPFVANTALKTPLRWQFSHSDHDQQTVHLQAAISINSTPAVLAAVYAGGGLSILPDYLVGQAVAAGDLLQVLPQWQLPSGGIHTVYPAARFRPAKVTAFVAMLAGSIAKP